MIHRFQTVQSTMLEAAALATAGCLHGTAVVAEEQTAGIGRHGHSWHSEPGAGLYVSLVLRLELPPTELPVLTLALGLATGEAIALATGLPCDLRWPNDVLTGNKKVAGILVQIVDNAAIAGIGINANHFTFPSDLTAEATSIRLALGHEIDRDTLLTQLLASIDKVCDLFLAEGTPAILKLFAAASSFASGKHVTVDLGPAKTAKRIEGITDGLTPQGFLRVRKPDGAIELVVAGGVRPCS